MTRVVICPFCGFNLPVRRYVQYCPVCDERIESGELFPQYRPLKAIDYAAPPPPRVAIRHPAEAADEIDADPEAEAMTLAALLELRPWYLRPWFIVLMLFCLTPLGIALLWAQRPRVGALGGALARSLATLLFGGAWLALALAALSSYSVQQAAGRLTAQAIQRLSNLEQVRQPVLVTRAAFNRLKPGDSRHAVLALLGREARCIARTRIDVTSSSLTPPLEMEALEWRNPDGSFIDLTFENGRLTKKEESGLPR